MKNLRLSFKDALSYKERMMDAKQKFKAASIGFAVTAMVCSSIPTTYASDIEIYKVPEDAVGSTTLMMMLDLSGSMGPGSSSYGSTSMSIQNDYAIIDANNNVIQNVCVNGGLGSNNKTVKTDSTTAQYPRYYCEIAANTTNPRVTDTRTGCEKQSNGTYRCYDRLTRLKDGLSQTLRGTATVPKIDDKIIVGLSTFAGNNGYIRVPARPLSEVLGTYQVQVTKTRTVYDTVPLYETQQEQYVVTPAVAAYDRPFWRRRTNSAAGNSYRYSTCSWNATTKTCNWSSFNSSSMPTGFNSSKSNKACTQNTDYNCREYYDTIPAVPAVMGTRPIQVQVGTQQVPRQETYQEWETRNTTQRDLLLTTIKDLSAEGGTPTAYAYAEAAAYLMGKTTKTTTPTNLRNYFNMNDSRVRDSTTYYAICNTWRVTSCSEWNYWYRNHSIPSSSTRDSNRSNFITDNDTYTGYYYTGPSSSVYTGFDLSSSDSKKSDQTGYISPISITSQSTNDAKKQCSGQGIYFLTDGEPGSGGVITGSDGTSGTAYNMMSKTLDTKASGFDCTSSPLGNRASYASENNGWSCIGKYAQALLDPVKNPAGVKIRTSVVGFGSSFGGGTTVNNDVEDAKSWGTIGDGGWIAGSKPEDVSKSINDFVGKLNKDIPSMSTGSSTIPIDALNPAAVQPYSYFPQFEPKVRPEDTQQIWFGNLKKYYVLNNSVYASETANDDTVVVKKSKLQDLADIWAKGGITYPENTSIFKKGGALSQLPLGTGANAEGQTTTARNLLTDYSYDGTKVESERVTRDFDLVKINYTYTLNDKTKTDTTYASALMSLLGYNIPSDTNTNGLDLSTQTAEVRQMGSIMHSNPVLLTQEGKTTATKDSTTGKISVGSTGREDYVLFGTTQGLVQVVDATKGVEKFAFVPKEIIERQSETFKNGGGNLAGGKEALYYGMDGEWTAHTVYVTKANGTLTVKGTARDIADSEEKENLSGKQWVYGGMRMGGRSYYALDLTDINNPKIKFHIDPSTSKVYNKDNPSGTTYAALAKMGQSWSKPTLGYVNWKGKRKLVMFVGGGYDAGGTNGDGLYSNGIRTGYAGYETYNYNQDNKIGAGVYMFDADNGDLLWNADSDSNSELKYSVASQIRAIDRNDDGVIDHVYFGDLAGQAFRVDFKNDGSKTAFTTQTTRILNLHQTDGTSPRFYTLPVFTAHYSAGSEKIYGGNIVLVTFVSGNKSSPLLATSDSPQKKDPSGLQYDGAYAIYDYDVYPSTSEGRYPSSHMAARTLAATTMTDPSATQLRYINNATTATTIDRDSGWGGWYYLFNKKFDDSDGSASIIKALTNPIALEGSLYVTQFDASNNGTTSSCGAGVKGHSFAQRLCLPTGVCKEDANYRYNLGSGIVTLNVGGGTDNDVYKRSLVVPDPNDICKGLDCKPCKGKDCDADKNFLNTGGALKFIPNRWYEKYARQEANS